MFFVVGIWVGSAWDCGNWILKGNQVYKFVPALYPQNLFVLRKHIFSGNNMFCDFYNSINRTYCKRLRVLCPEHCKDPKITEYEVCGCPLVVNVFSPTGEFCRAPKKSCTKHFVWEKLRRAEIDLERVRQWLKIDELLEKERQIRTSMASRAGVLALMLHSTYNHELMERIAAQGLQNVPRDKQVNSRYSQIVVLKFVWQKMRGLIYSLPHCVW